jgi:hypothetical protein
VAAAANSNAAVSSRAAQLAGFGMRTVYAATEWAGAGGVAWRARTDDDDHDVVAMTSFEHPAWPVVIRTTLPTSDSFGMEKALAISHPLW